MQAMTLRHAHVDNWIELKGNGEKNVRVRMIANAFSFRDVTRHHGRKFLLSPFFFYRFSFSRNISKANRR